MLGRNAPEAAKLVPDKKASDAPRPPRPAKPEHVGVVFYLFNGSSDATTVAKIKQTGGNVVSQGSDGTTVVVRARLPLQNITDVAAVPQVQQVINDVPQVLRNDVASKLMAGGSPPLGHDPYVPPLQAGNQVVGHADEGLDVGKNDATLHEAFRGRLKAAFALGRATANDWSDFGGHGTHTAGSILGGGKFAGLASKALLVHQSVGDDQGGLGGIPAPFGKLFNQAYQEGARIHSDSWGVQVKKNPDLAGEYGNGIDVDSWCWNNGNGPRDMLIVIAAGNDGELTPPPIAVGTVGSPATAKDCLAVGACDTSRPAEGALRRRPETDCTV